MRFARGCNSRPLLTFWPPLLALRLCFCYASGAAVALLSSLFIPRHDAGLLVSCECLSALTRCSSPARTELGPFSVHSNSKAGTFFVLWTD
ncbi:hypothetical protein IWZ03DRAFT_126708 [Phyllosticta citriasiana]|uniref:Secreted protein n=1 Tax=Phyllosticta citriasiana TaxID=595635 RepID=A0ABR1KR30_9PEZI